MTRTACAIALAGMLGVSVAGPAAQAADGKVVVGVLTDQSGMFSGFSGPGGVLAARMAVEDFGGKVLGKPVEVIDADHQNKTDIGAEIARRWYDLEGVDAIVDIPNSAVALAVQNLARERSKIMIASSPGTSDLSNKNCSPTTFQWTWDTYSSASSTGRAILAEGGDTWFILGADYAFGHSMGDDLTRIVNANGGRVVGSAYHPLNTHDLGSFLVQAQASGAKVIALANGGEDTVNSIKQAHEFGLTKAGQRLVALGMEITEVHAIGLPSAEGLEITTSFYWDRTPETRDWAKRFAQRHHDRRPTADQAGVYSAVLQYLKAVADAGTTEGTGVAASLHRLPVNDLFAQNGRVREDGRMVHDMFLVEVKRPAESQYNWDYMKVLRRIPGEEAVRPVAESSCGLLRH